MSNVNNANNANNVPPPPPSEPHPNNIAVSTNVPAKNAPKVNASNSVVQNTTKRVTAYLPQQRGEAITFREYTVETKIVDETTSLTL
jgi:hypothetical protein